MQKIRIRDYEAAYQIYKIVITEVGNSVTPQSCVFNLGYDVRPNGWVAFSEERAN